MHRSLLLSLGAALIAAPSVAMAQSARRVAPVCIGDCANVAGLRINFRDRKLEQVDGINITVWGPYDPAGGMVRGLALGVPSTGAGSLEGIAVAVLGFSATESFRGIGVGGIGAGIGGNAQGILVGGAGAGIGGSFRGAMIGGVGVGGGGSLDGLMIAGIGAGVGGSLSGISIAGIGAGVGGSMRGISIAGIGVGAGGSVSGLSIAGIGIGSGGSVRGITAAGIGVGAGESVDGITIAGIGIGSPSIEKLAMAPMIGTARARGLMIAPAYFKVKDGSMRGVSIATVNDVRGEQTGLSIGLVNYARSLSGLQLGLVNIVTDGRGPRVMPIANWR